MEFWALAGAVSVVVLLLLVTTFARFLSCQRWCGILSGLDSLAAGFASLRPTSFLVLCLSGSDPRSCVIKQKLRKMWRSQPDLLKEMLLEN